MTTKTAQLRDSGSRASQIQWEEDSPLSMTIETRQGEITTKYGKFVGGVSDQIEVIEVDTGAVRALILPTRGMGIWKIEKDGVSFSWDSPISGPVHPTQVPIHDPSGIGWLEGFDELVVRCGLESNGAPEHDANGNLTYPLHGRVGNLPAQSLSIEFDEASGRLDVIGEVIESRLFIKRLRMRSRVRFQAGNAEISLLDDVTNDLSKPATMQLLYHINVGHPVLDAGSVLEAPLARLAPKDELSASEMETWNQFDGPESGFSERVYFAELRSDENSSTTAMLRSSGSDRGLAVSFNTSGLPKFIIWKNTAATSDGYVTGLEPATNFPNQRSYEANQGRVVELQPDETVAFRVTLEPLTTTEDVERVNERIQDLRGDLDPEIHDKPKEGWSPR
ncbi:aldose 1-epimerase family protein [Rhodopirellula sp.]|nr:aldose 1-epimerase family protein [Rhodopirellula sp.]MDB4679263.1 aldose 1-epimerase family protein [Rhodopirellula sp.]